MIIVRVELHSAITGDVTELARMRICNDDTGSASIGNYTGVTFRGRDRTALDQAVANRHGTVRNYPRLAIHVWHLVARMLHSMGYR